MFADPGPMDAVQASACSRLLALAIPGRRMHHALLIAGQVVRQIGLARRGGLQQGLPDAGHVAVTEDAEAARDQPLLHAVALAVLLGQEAHQRLRDRQSDRCHDFPVECLCRLWLSGWSVSASPRRTERACRASSRRPAAAVQGLDGCIGHHRGRVAVPGAGTELAAGGDGVEPFGEFDVVGADEPLPPVLGDPAAERPAAPARSPGVDSARLTVPCSPTISPRMS